jgi:hypothetical protein
LDETSFYAKVIENGAVKQEMLAITEPSKKQMKRDRTITQPE